MKVLFLDIDGVLNSVKYFLRVRNYKDIIKSKLAEKYKDNYAPFDNLDKLVNSLYSLDEKAVEHLKTIVNKTHCKIVLSSSLRYGIDAKQMQFLLEQKVKDFPKDVVIDRTTLIPLENRGYEIQKWIDDNKFKGKFCVIDDEEITLDNQPRVTPKSFAGLTTNEMNQVISFLA